MVAPPGAVWIVNAHEETSIGKEGGGRRRKTEKENPKGI